VVASFGSPEHPSSVFGWGNLKTLKETTDDDTLYEQVHEFRRRHYSAHRMALVMQARLPLDVLEVDCYFECLQQNMPILVCFSGFGGKAFFQHTEQSIAG
jgi:nardilysin